MTSNASEVRIRPVEELDIEEIAAIDERIGGEYRPDVWERRVFYYIRRDPAASVVAWRHAATPVLPIGSPLYVPSSCTTFASRNS